MAHRVRYCAASERRLLGELRKSSASRKYESAPRISGSSKALDPECFRRTAPLTCEREILELPAEQNWCDADNDHFRSANRTRRRRPCFWWHFLASHAISFRRGEATHTRAAPSWALKSGHHADVPHGKRRVAADLRPRARAAHT
jgi:hypothetical protein